MEEQTKEEISKILRLVLEILEEIRYLKEHRSMLEGDPMLEFSEVCQMLRQSERQVRRYREQGRLVGFNFGHRRMYLLSEVQEFIRKMRKQGKLETLKDTNQ
ncbi:MAG: helix-turn-helix domain-containing protein [Alistipes sp.]|nr:helix-turn-helix domain-containing protein [Alistipes sp.]